MNDIIQVDYEQLETITQRFNTLSEDIQTVQRTIQQRVDALIHGGWVGRGSTAFYNEMSDDVLPALARLDAALAESSAITRQIAVLFNAAEEEAAAQFQVLASGFGIIDGFLDRPANDDGGVLGWIGDRAGDAWGWIEDHRDEVALGAAVVAAGVATVLTAGAAAPIIAGAVAAGGLTLGINAASPKYDLFDGVLGNAVSGAFIGWGVGSTHTAINALRGISKATPWAASIGGAASQTFASARLALPVARVMTFAPPVLEAISGSSMVVSGGGLDWLIPERMETAVHTTSNVLGMSATATNLAASLGGNMLIKHAWNNPLAYQPGGQLTGAGNSAMFQGHHFYPQKELGQLAFAKDLLDDAVLIPSGRNPFIPNLHQGAADSIHGFIRENIKSIGGRSMFDVMPPAQQLQFLQKVNNQYLSGILTQAQLVSHAIDPLVWAGKLGVNKVF